MKTNGKPLKKHEQPVRFLAGKPGKLVNIPEAQVKSLCTSVRTVFLEQSAARSTSLAQTHSKTLGNRCLSSIFGRKR